MEYKNVPGTEYSVSRTGALLGIHGMAIRGHVSGVGYRQLKMRIDGKISTTGVHRLVWRAWVGEIPKGLWINHKDGNKLNNDLENLEMTTPSENHLHAYRVLNRNRATGMEVHTAKLTPEMLDEIRELHASGVSQRKIAKKFGVSQVAIYLQLKKMK